MKKMMCVSVALFGLLTAGSALRAQLGTDGTVLGTITDSSGAIIPGAQVTVTNLATGLKKTVKADQAGDFEIVPLPAGMYAVTVSFKGFKTWTIERTELTVGERKRLSPVLQVGQISETVTVTSTAELMQTERASVESVVESRQIVDTPLNGRDVIELVRLVPGVRYMGKSDYDNESFVQGLGNRSDQTEFNLDGIRSTGGLDEHSGGIPNVDTIAEFKVETADFTAEHGRNPLQVIMVTKSGSNNFHGSAWEFLRNDRLDARNTFATTKPKLRRNQFGFTVGGPIIKDKTHFFGSYEGNRIRQEQIYNSPTIDPKFLQGDFSSLGTPIIDPLTGTPFQNNQIPLDRFSGASQFFFPYILAPNSPGNLFKAVAPLPDDTFQYTFRIDHQISSRQKIYGRWFHSHNTVTIPHYRPDIIENDTTGQYSIGLNYDLSISPRTLFNLNVGSLGTVNRIQSPILGKENLTEEAGIRGFPTAGRAAWVGLPNSITFAGYTGIETPFGAPYKLWWQTAGGSASFHLIRARHSVAFGYQFDHRNTLARHGSCCTRGVFDFNGQYTGNGFADYLLGYLDSGARNFPIQTFGMKHNPYSALFVQDSWQIHPRVTLDLGVRWDHWHAKTLVRGNAASFDTKIGKAVAGEDNNGKVDLTAQPVAPFLAKATEGLWVPASQIGAPRGLFEPTSYVAPRLGIAWRPLGSNDLVVRAGYGIFTSSIRGNTTASSIIGPPYWTFESQAWSPAQLQKWETAWPENPQAFVAPSVYATAINLKPNKSHQWNISIQKSLPLKSALTVAYVGNRNTDMMVDNSLDNVPPGLYADLQAARPWPGFGSVDLYMNTGTTWYNSLQLKWERRFTNGLSALVSYAFSKAMTENGGAGIWNTPTPFAPKGYNRGRASDFCTNLANNTGCDAAADHTHILAINAVWELPVGRKRHFGKTLHPVLNGIAGGWEFSTLYNFISGDPLTFSVPSASLGNGWGTRPDLVGSPRLSNPSAAKWFNPDAFKPPPDFVFGNSGLGIMDGPGFHEFNVALLKNFYIKEDKYLQFRWEMFNAINHANLCDPVTTIGFATTAQIFCAAPARDMQMGLKFIF